MNESLENSILSDHGTLKNNDCYFYYYSTCTKGDACPYRHEPAALRSETTCLYWLNGSCNKDTCIYRHMDIKKNRNRIQCFFENQPGGCRKLHCPFLHDKVLDQPRDEDIIKDPDLILPVKGLELEDEPLNASKLKEIQDNIIEQLKFHRNVSRKTVTSEDSGINAEANSKSSSPFPSIQRESFIVSLQDGESDSECDSSPVKKQKTCEQRRVVLEENWEIERLRQIQEEEGNLLGYSFASYEETEEGGQQQKEVCTKTFSNDRCSQQTHLISTSSLPLPSSQSFNGRDELGEEIDQVSDEYISSLDIDPVFKKNLTQNHRKMGDYELDAFGRRIIFKLLDGKGKRLQQNKQNGESYADIGSDKSRSRTQGNSLLFTKHSLKDRLGPINKERIVQNCAPVSTRTVHVGKPSLDDTRIKSSDSSTVRKLGLKGRSISSGTKIVYDTSTPLSGSRSFHDSRSSSGGRRFAQDNKTLSKCSRSASRFGYTSSDILSKSLDDLISHNSEGLLKDHTSRFSSRHLQPADWEQTNPSSLKIKTLSEIKAEKMRTAIFTDAQKNSLPKVKRSLSPITFEPNSKDKRTKLLKDSNQRNGDEVLSVLPGSSSLPYKKLTLKQRLSNKINSKFFTVS